MSGDKNFFSFFSLSLQKEEEDDEVRMLVPNIMCLFFYLREGEKSLGPMSD